MSEVAEKREFDIETWVKNGVFNGLGLSNLNTLINTTPDWLDEFKEKNKEDTKMSSTTENFNTEYVIPRTHDEKIKLILEIIKNNAPITRGEIVKLTNIPRTTIYDIIVELMIMKQVEKFCVPRKTRGRPKVYYRTISII